MAPDGNKDETSPAPNMLLTIFSHASGVCVTHICRLKETHITPESAVYVFGWTECQSKVLRVPAERRCLIIFLLCEAVASVFFVISSRVAFFMRQLGKYLKAMHFVFQYIPARKEDFTALTESAVCQFPLCWHR